MRQPSRAMYMLLKIAKTELDLSAERLAKANRAINEAKEQKEQLIFYRQDYLSKKWKSPYKWYACERFKKF